MKPVLLRQWRQCDLAAFAAMNADPDVMRYFPATLSFAQSAASMERLQRGIAERGWGVWAVEVGGAFAGMAGLSQPQFAASFTPCTEVLWRFRKEFWGRGVAFQGAKEALAFGFGQLGLAEIVAYTAAINMPSRRLMDRLGFRYDPGADFDHPALPTHSPLRPHALYQLCSPEMPPAPLSSER